MMQDARPHEVTIPPVEGVFAQQWSPRKLLGMLRMFGPAAIVASVAIGAGETIVVVQAGAWAGYELMWLVALSVLVKGVFVTYLLGRYTAVSGEHVGHRLVRLPGPRGWLLITILVLEMIIAPLSWAAISRPCGDLLHFLLQDVFRDVMSESVCESILTTVFLALALGLSLLLTYDRLEKQQIVICGILVVGTVVGTLMVRPDFTEAFLGTARVGRLPSELPSWTPAHVCEQPLLMMVTLFGYVGGSAMAYLVYANWLSLHGWGITGHKDIDAIRAHAATRERIDYLPDDPAQVRRLRKLTAPLRWDVTMGALVLWVVSATFMMAGAAVLYPMLEKGEIQSGFQGFSLLTEQAFIWRNIHPYLVWVYYICILAALWGTLQALPEVYTRVTHEFCQAVWPRRIWDIRTIQRSICGYLFVATVTLVWFEVSFATLIEVVAFLGTNLAIALIMFAALYLNFRLPPAYRTRRVMLVGGIASAVILSAATMISGWQLAMKWFGSAPMSHG